MIERVEDRFALKPDRLIGDTNYGTAEILGWMVDEKQIEPHVPVWDKTLSRRVQFSLQGRPLGRAGELPDRHDGGNRGRR